jgi:hypothetical protein
MNFATTSKDSTYNFYSFNDSTGNWEYLNKPKTVTAATKIKYKTPSKGFLQYQYLSRSPARIYDSTNFEQRFESNKHMYTCLKDTANLRGLTYREHRKDRHRSLRSLVKISSVRKTKEGDVLFKVTYLDYAHPELKEFKNVYFALNENMTANEFKQKYVRQKYYNDIRVYTNGGGVEIKFKDAKSVKDVSATMVMLGEKGKIKDVKDSNARMKKYNKLLKGREREFNKKLVKGKIEGNTIQITDPKQLSQYAFGQVQQYMNAEERKMSYAEWLTYSKQLEEEQKLIQAENEKNLFAATKEKIIELNQSEANSSNLIQSLSLDGMGIYNCDQIQRMKKPVEIFAKYKTTDDIKLKPVSAYVIDKHSNSVFQYDGYKGFDANKIAFDKTAAAKNTLLAINEDGSIAIYSTEDFKKHEFRNWSHFDFEVTKINSKFTSVGELKTLIGF